MVREVHPAERQVRYRQTLSWIQERCNIVTVCQCGEGGPSSGETSKIQADIVMGTREM